MNFTFHSTDGALLITEWTYLLNQISFPGNYKIGAYYTTGTSQKFAEGMQKGNYGYYFLFDQMLYQKKTKDQGLSYFAAILFAPKNRNRFPFFLSTGFVYQGVARRPLDAISLGVAYGSYSADLRHAQRMAVRDGNYLQGFPQTSETVLEINYWFHVNKWLVFYS